jgi:hypothetical protein
MTISNNNNNKNLMQLWIFFSLRTQGYVGIWSLSADKCLSSSTVNPFVRNDILRRKK